MTHDDIYCHHECLNGIKHKHEFNERMNLSNYSQVGNSDCGLVLTDFLTRFPDSPILVIHRPLQEVLQSVNEIFPGYECEEFLKEIDGKLNRLPGFHIGFSEINSHLKQIHRYLTGQEVDWRRIELFKDLKIEPMNIFGSSESLSLWM